MPSFRDEALRAADDRGGAGQAGAPRGQGEEEFVRFVIPAAC
ncbi:MAG TPA: hypothetical protein VI248_08305 [Kineosporiaceae bacterium]